MTIQEEIAKIEAEEQATGPQTENTIESIELKNKTYHNKLFIQFNVLETNNEYEYHLKELYWYDVDQLIEEVEENAYIPEPFVEDLIELYDSI